MKKPSAFFTAALFAAALVLSFSGPVSAKIEWEILKDVQLGDSPKDITMTGDGSTAYILTEKSILAYSVRRGKITSTIPLRDSFSQITVDAKGEQLFLTSAKSSKLSIVQISEVYDIPVGDSSVIGPKNAPVTLALFLDYQ